MLFQTALFKRQAPTSPSPEHPVTIPRPAPLADDSRPARYHHCAVAGTDEYNRDRRVYIFCPFTRHRFSVCLPVPSQFRDRAGPSLDTCGGCPVSAHPDPVRVPEIAAILTPARLCFSPGSPVHRKGQNPQRVLPFLNGMCPTLRRKAASPAGTPRPSPEGAAKRVQVTTDRRTPPHPPAGCAR